MNLFARLLFIVGWVSIGAGVMLAFANYQVVVGYDEPLFIWIQNL
ncbi:hypothetical protein [Oceanobacillus kimchii]|nr:hypothetical protein [Oceanobacillus kimchii]